MRHDQLPNSGDVGDLSNGRKELSLTDNLVKPIFMIGINGTLTRNKATPIPNRDRNIEAALDAGGGDVGVKLSGNYRTTWKLKASGFESRKQKGNYD